MGAASPNWPALSLTALIAALSATLLLELAWPLARASTNPLPTSSIADPHKPDPPPVVPIDIDGILARPLFAPSRRAAVMPTPPTAKRAIVTPLRLAGVILSPTGARAIFVRQGSKPTVVSDGDHVGNDIVESITADTAILAGPNGRQALRITPDPAARVTSHMLRAVDQSPGG